MIFLRLKISFLPYVEISAVPNPNMNKFAKIWTKIWIFSRPSWSSSFYETMLVVAVDTPGRPRSVGVHLVRYSHYPKWTVSILAIINCQRASVQWYQMLPLFPFLTSRSHHLRFPEWWLSSFLNGHQCVREASLVMSVGAWGPDHTVLKFIFGGSWCVWSESCDVEVILLHKCWCLFLGSKFRAIDNNGLVRPFP